MKLARESRSPPARRRRICKYCSWASRDYGWWGGAADRPGEVDGDSHGPASAPRRRRPVWVGARSPNRLPHQKPASSAISVAQTLNETLSRPLTGLRFAFFTSHYLNYTVWFYQTATV